jgi:hypothetical protein
MKSKLSISPISLNIVLGLLASALLFYKGLSYQMPAIVYFRLAIIGLLAWSLIEYIIQFIFSKILPTKLGHFFFWQLHGDHYQFPEDRRFIFYPLPTLILTTGAIFYILKTFTPIEYLYTFCAILIVYYLAMAHLHHLYHGKKTELPLVTWMQQFHLEHHKNKNTRYGITTPLWDLLFNTLN